MYNFKDIQFAGKHDFYKASEENMVNQSYGTVSIGIFQWELKNHGKSLKKGKTKVRISGPPAKYREMVKKAEEIVLLLDAVAYAGAKTVKVK